MPALKFDPAGSWDAVLRDGEPIRVRAITPADEPLLVAFHQSLGERTVRMRYFSAFKLDTRISHERLARICMSDSHTDIVQVAQNAGGAIVAIARLSRIEGTNAAEFAILVRDAYQGKGIGTKMVARLLEIARAERIDKVVAEILNENREMQHICRRLGFTLSALDPCDSTLTAEYVVAK